MSLYLGKRVVSSQRIKGHELWSRVWLYKEMADLQPMRVRRTCLSELMAFHFALFFPLKLASHHLSHFFLPEYSVNYKLSSLPRWEEVGRVRREIAILTNPSVGLKTWLGAYSPLV